jgi:hypothetical protein
VFLHHPAWVWKLLPDDIPDDLVVDAEIVMDQPVPHASHAPPVDPGLAGAELDGEILDCLTDHLEAAYEGRLKGFLFQKLLPAEPFGTIEDEDRLGQYVQQKDTSRSISLSGPAFPPRTEPKSARRTTPRARISSAASAMRVFA